MEATIDLLWKIVLWGFGTCITGFLFLAGWIWWLMRMFYEHKLHKKTVESIEKNLSEIHQALVGTLEKKGLINRHYEVEADIERIKSKCDKRYPAESKL